MCVRPNRYVSYRPGVVPPRRAVAVRVRARDQRQPRVLADELRPGHRQERLVDPEVRFQPPVTRVGDVVRRDLHRRLHPVVAVVEVQLRPGADHAVRVAPVDVVRVRHQRRRPELRPRVPRRPGVEVLRRRRSPRKAQRRPEVPRHVELPLPRRRLLRPPPAPPRSSSPARPPAARPGSAPATGPLPPSSSARRRRGGRRRRSHLGGRCGCRRRRVLGEDRRRESRNRQEETRQDRTTGGSAYSTFPCFASAVTSATVEPTLAPAETCLPDFLDAAADVRRTSAGRPRRGKAKAEPPDRGGTKVAETDSIERIVNTRQRGASDATNRPIRRKHALSRSSLTAVALAGCASVSGEARQAEVSPVVPPTTPPAPDGVNPFAGARLYVNPDYVKAVQALEAAHASEAALLKRMESLPTAIWLSWIADTKDVPRYLDDALQQQKAGGQPVVPLFVVYDLPGRDCAAESSAGELSADAAGEARYQHAFIDVIAAAFRAHPDQRIAVVLEPDSLSNLVTNLDRPRCQTAEGDLQARDRLRHQQALAPERLPLPRGGARRLARLSEEHRPGRGALQERADDGRRRRIACAASRSTSRTTIPPWIPRRRRAIGPPPPATRPATPPT